MEEVADLSLIRSVARRDRPAFQALYDRYAPRLGRYAFKLLRNRESVDEVMNDVMLAVWQDAARFDEAVSTVSAWLFGITHKKVLKMLERTRTRSRDVPLDHEENDRAGEGSGARDPERAAMGRQLGSALASALEQLPPDQRAVVELTFGEGQSYQEIAQVMGCPVNTVKTRMFHARKRLARLLGEEGGEDGWRQLP